MSSAPNRLDREHSPYLRQHRHNPVDWFPWGDEAFEQARAGDKPVFLSIGYSTCHWCHVMARESFEDDETAALLNRDFISIKVDREERPDVDHLYMTYVQATTGHGGWPLSVWLTPDGKPFFGGTYFPPDDHPQRMGFRSVLGALVKAWRERRDELVREADRVVAALRNNATADPGGPGRLDSGEITVAARRAYQWFFEAFDEKWGGFGGAPKFPRPAGLRFLLAWADRESAGAKRGESERLVLATLRGMVMGGVHDHVGGGFHRYSVDAEWHVPHFEKMLYDQAQLVPLLFDATRRGGHPAFAWAARRTLEYAGRILAAPEGGYYSAEDADSADPDGGDGHREGAYYVWTRAEVERVVEGNSELVCAQFDVRAEGNVTRASDPHGELAGKNVLRQLRPLGETAVRLGIDPALAEDRIATALQALDRVRGERPRPHRDEKILTGWNGLFLSALAAGIRSVGAEEGAALWAQAAEATVDRLRRERWDASAGRLRRCPRGEGEWIEGFADDYAFLIQGLLDLYGALGDAGLVEWAVEVQEAMDVCFRDEAAGGYFQAPADEGGGLVARLKEDYDGAEPAPGSVAAMNLLRLTRLTGRHDFRQRAEGTILSMRRQWTSAPHGVPVLLAAALLGDAPEKQVVVAGPPGDPATRELLREARSRLPLEATLVWADGAENQRRLVALRPEWADYRPVDGRPAAFVCENFSCQRPVFNPAELRGLF